MHANASVVPSVNQGGEHQVCVTSAAGASTLLPHSFADRLLADSVARAFNDNVALDAQARS